jgi:hypothetical protein
VAELRAELLDDESSEDMLLVWWGFRLVGCLFWAVVCARFEAGWAEGCPVRAALRGLPPR